MKESKSELSQDADEETGKKRSNIRIAFPQVLASSVKNLILIDLGMCVAYPTIVIPALQNAAGSLSLTDEQTSWFGSVGLMVQPIGSIASGLILEKLGRKKAMIVVNFPHIIGWLMYYFSQSAAVLFATAVIMGLGVGFMEAPVITYVAEISQPHLRGVLTSYAGICVQLGFFIEYLLGTTTDWRTAAMISVAVPIFTVIALTQVPETPVWLLSKGRENDAEKSLQWLRGWVSPRSVRKEFSELVEYNKEMQEKKKRMFGYDNKAFVDVQENGVDKNEKAVIDIVNNQKQSEVLRSAPVMAKIKEVFKRQTLRPLILVIVYFFIHHASGISGIRPFMVQLFDEFGMPIDGHWAAVATAIIGFVGNFLCMSVVHWTGKRPISLISVLTMGLAALFLGTYAYYVIPSSQPGDGSRYPYSWIPPTLFFVLFFMHSFAAGPIPWMMLSEVFPFTTRGLASGIAAAMFYVMAFGASKSFFALKSSLHLEGVFWLYGVLTLAGLVYLYIELYETEGKTLEEIEQYYGNKGRKGASHTFQETYSNLDPESMQLGNVKDTKERIVTEAEKSPKDTREKNEDKNITKEEETKDGDPTKNKCKDEESNKTGHST